MLFLVEFLLLVFSAVNGDSRLISNDTSAYILRDLGDSLTAECIGEDTDQCYYKWYKNKLHLTDGNKLDLVSVQPSDEGLYECKGCNNTNKSFFLDLKVFAPREADNDSQVTFCSPVGNNITLSRAIFAKPELYIVKDSPLLPENVNKNDTLLTLEKTGKYDYLLQWTFNISSPRFFGRFCINVSNVKGTLYVCITLKEEDWCTTVPMETLTKNSTELDLAFSFFSPLPMIIGTGVAIIFALIFTMVFVACLKRNKKKGGYNIEQEEMIYQNETEVKRK